MAFCRLSCMPFAWEECTSLIICVQTLYLDDALMFDPLSLSDFPSMKGALEAEISVKVALLLHG